MKCQTINIGEMFTAKHKTTEMTNWTNKLKSNPIDWLLDSNPWTKYRTLTDLLEKDYSDNEVKDTKSQLLENEKIISLVNETKDWLTIASTRNSDPKISYFKLRILADFGLIHSDLGLEETANTASLHMIDNMFGVRGELPKQLKKGEKYEKPDLSADVWHISPCNSPVISYALLGLGVKNELVVKSIEALKINGLMRKAGFAISSLLKVSLKSYK